ncbi:MAG: hypothetical protein LBF28_00920 [Rickettsiales bacterium]|jgi:hypothetical protein|nr:hypothetical protein [Rickettsiales bacterium]
MKTKANILKKSKTLSPERGATMVDLLLTVALIAIVLPFIFNFQKSRIERAKNIAAVAEMGIIQAALERYIDSRGKELMLPVGRNITSVKMADLAEYGVPQDSVEKRGDNFQIRILKSQNREGHSTLQGIVVLNERDITPLRAREIVNIGGDKMGFVEEGRAFGAFGTWAANASDLGIQGSGGIIETTKITLDQDKFLWRVPSENADDATMLSPLNLAGHDIVNAKFLDAAYVEFEEILKAAEIVADKTIFQTRTTLDKNYETSDAAIAGTLSADSRNMDISGTLSLSGTGKFTSFTADDLQVVNLNLSGLSISTTNSKSKAAILKVNQTIDMVTGHISAMFATVGFTGSITPKLVVKNRIEDSTNSDYFWDASGGSARLSDISIPELNRMATLISSRESGAGTDSKKLFDTAAANKNATVSDFMNAISKIQNRVSVKYRQLNLD